MSEWTSLNVVEWMAALNLYRYADVFKSKDIKGSDLPFLDRDKLMVSGSVFFKLVSAFSFLSKFQSCIFIPKINYLLSR